MEQDNISCPHCKKLLLWEEKRAGQVGRCPFCNGYFTYPRFLWPLPKLTQKKDISLENKPQKKTTVVGTKSLSEITGYAIYSRPISNQSVQRKDLHDIEDIINAAINKIQNSAKIYLCNLTISGYDNDPRELVEIPEVRIWCREAHAKAPYLPYLLANDSLEFYLFSLIDLEVTSRDYDKRKVQVFIKSKSQLKELLSEIKIAGTNFFEKCNIKNVKDIVEKNDKRLREHLPPIEEENKNDRIAHFFFCTFKNNDVFYRASDYMRESSKLLGNIDCIILAHQHSKIDSEKTLDEYLAKKLENLASLFNRNAEKSVIIGQELLIEMIKLYPNGASIELFIFRTDKRLEEKINSIIFTLTKQFEASVITLDNKN